jgi:hypothetical protein
VRELSRGPELLTFKISKALKTGIKLIDAGLLE